ncbi:DUF3108 domain-containing protein [Limibaculum sp. M0105]|uniref:DUF3108 domain-containing protein n=1 Tax=Thermohalobaculum xanthum TaxID=2753746 RepID=A0A8J7MB22_9RHOB|nr:DUF3108 domain-containing protein [Thermohalobaculum xanthum]MBK0400824.1 DUF3108 domain-containing protein [Thermohalobaculum xanthum]
MLGPTTRSLALAGGLAAALAAPAGVGPHPGAMAALNPGSFGGIYDLYLGGIRGGEMSIRVELEDARYRAEAAGQTAGIVGTFWSAGFAAVSEGQSDRAGVSPMRFEADSFSPGKTQKVAMAYESGRPAAIEAEPPFTPKPWQVDPFAQAGAFDPLTAALSGLALQSRAQICDRSVEIFDGRRRYAIDIGPPQADPEGLRCDAAYRRVAGYKPKLMRKPDWPFTMWFAQGADGLWHVTRAMGDTPLGVAAVKLRDE